MKHTHLELRWINWFESILGDCYSDFVDDLQIRINNFSDDKYVRNVYTDTYILKEDLRKIVIDYAEKGLRLYQIGKILHCSPGLFSEVLTKDEIKKYKRRNYELRRD